jgi:hypothetical protein
MRKEAGTFISAPIASISLARLRGFGRLRRRFRRLDLISPARASHEPLVVKTFSVKLLFLLNLDIGKRPNPRRRVKALTILSSTYDQQ